MSSPSRYATKACANSWMGNATNRMTALARREGRLKLNIAPLCWIQSMCLHYCHQPCGGCQPTLTHSLRARTETGLFILSATTVARPIDVKPITCVPSSLHAKCSSQLCCLGLYKGTRFVLSGIHAFSLIGLVRVALRAGPTQIHLFRHALARERDNVVYLQRNTGDALGSPTVFALIPQCMQPTPQPGRDVSRVQRPNSP